LTAGRAVVIIPTVEKGFSLFRPNNDGVSVATDYLDRTIAKMDYFAAEDPVVVARLPTRGVWTFYPRAGDVFA
jgi:apolipoprotein N-acyltransferase